MGVPVHIHHLSELAPWPPVLKAACAWGQDSFELVASPFRLALDVRVVVADGGIFCRQHATPPPPPHPSHLPWRWTSARLSLAPLHFVRLTLAPHVLFSCWFGGTTGDQAMLIDCFAIPAVMVLSRLFLKARYTKQYAHTRFLI